MGSQPDRVACEGRPFLSRVRAHSAAAQSICEAATLHRPATANSRLPDKQKHSIYEN